MSSACSAPETASVHSEKVQCSMTHQSYLSSMNRHLSSPDPCKLGSLPDNASTALTERKESRKLAERAVMYCVEKQILKMGS